MLLDVYLMLIAIGIILFVLGIERESMAYAGTSFVLWMIIFAQSFWVYVPGDTGYADYTMNAVSLAFILINVVWMFWLVLEKRKREEWRPPMPGQGGHP